MSLDQAVLHKKEHRQPFRKSKSFDPSCRNHGRCSWCVGNRTYHDQKAESSADERGEQHDIE